MMRDLALLMPLAVARIAARPGALPRLAGAAWCCRWPRCCSSTLWTFGAIALLGRPLTILTVILAPNLIAIGSVYGVHLLARYEEEALASPDAPSAALRCLEHMTAPVLISGLTTVIGFASCS